MLKKIEDQIGQAEEIYTDLPPLAYNPAWRKRQIGDRMLKTQKMLADRKIVNKRKTELACSISLASSDSDEEADPVAYNAMPGDNEQ